MKRFDATSHRFALLTCFALAACGQGDEVHSFGVGVSANPLYVSEGLVWPAPWEIPVCWETRGWEDEKAWTQEAIELSWELFSHVDFTGWGDCPSSSSPGIRIYWTTSGDGKVRGVTKGLGTTLNGVLQGMRLNTWTNQHCVADTSFTREDCVRSSAVHEFGHALGFAHEHNRPDNAGQCNATGGSPGTVEIGELDLQSTMSYCAVLRNGAGYLTDTDIAGLQMFYGMRKLSAFGYDQGYRSSRNPRMLADVNNDGLQDIVGFASDGVYVSRAENRRYPVPEDAFTAPKRYVAAYGETAGGWRVANHPRMMADVNADGRADVVGFASDGVYVSLANSKGTAFGASTLWVAAYGYTAGGWRVDQHPRMMADVNADDRADVVGFANDGVYVSLANAAGTGFGASRRWVAQFGQDQSWNTTSHIRMMIDVNRDRRADVVGFGNGGVYVSLANSAGTAFAARALWVANFGVNSAAGGWTLPNNPRFLARVNGDTLPDIVGFGANHVYVSINTGSGFNAPAIWARDRFGTAAAAGGWSASKHIRTVADVDGDRLADLVGFGDKNVTVALARASDFGASRAWSVGYDLADGWAVTENPRVVAQVDGAPGADLIGFGDDGLHSTSLSIPINAP